MNEIDSSNKPLVKGEVLIGLLNCIKGLPEGEALHGQVLSGLPDDSAKVCGGEVVAIADYPYSVFTDCIRALDKIQGNGDLRTCRDLGKRRSSEVIQSFSEIFSKDMKIEDLFLLGDAIWNSNHVNSGYIKIEDPSPDSSLVRIYDFCANGPLPLPVYGRVPDPGAFRVRRRLDRGNARGQMRLHRRPVSRVRGTLEASPTPMTDMAGARPTS